MFHIYFSNISREEGVILSLSDNVLKCLFLKFIQNQVLIIFNRFAKNSSGIIRQFSRLLRLSHIYYMEIARQSLNLKQNWPFSKLRCSHLLPVCAFNFLVQRRISLFSFRFLRHYQNGWWTMWFQRGQWRRESTKTRSVGVCVNHVTVDCSCCQNH